MAVRIQTSGDEMKQHNLSQEREGEKIEVFEILNMPFFTIENPNFKLINTPVLVFFCLSIDQIYPHALQDMDWLI